MRHLVSPEVASVDQLVEMPSAVQQSERHCRVLSSNTARCSRPPSAWCSVGEHRNASSVTIVSHHHHSMTAPSSHSRSRAWGRSGAQRPYQHAQSGDRARRHSAGVGRRKVGSGRMMGRCGFRLAQCSSSIESRRSFSNRAVIGSDGNKYRQCSFFTISVFSEHARTYLEQAHIKHVMGIGLSSSSHRRSHFARSASPPCSVFTGEYTAGLQLDQFRSHASLPNDFR